MTHARLLEHLDSAVRQDEPARRLRLAGIVLATDAEDPFAQAIVALSVPDLRRAGPLLDRVAERAKRPGALSGASPELRVLVEVARASRDLTGLDPHAVVERLGGIARRGDLPDTLRAPLLRLLLAASAATGDLDNLHAALERAKPLAALKRETPWFSYLLAKRLGKPGADALLDAAEAALPCVREAIEGDGPEPKPCNPGAFADGDEGVALAAILPGLFQAGGLPERKRVARAA